MLPDTASSARSSVRAKLLALLGSLAVAVSTATAGETPQPPQQHFVTIAREHSTLTYDLSSVRALLLDRFVIQSTTLDAPEVMQYHLKALDVIRGFCAKPAGQYSLPAEMPTLHLPTIASEGITVVENPNGKLVHWESPYKAIDGGLLICGGAASGGKIQTEEYLYNEARRSITNGFILAEVFDCGHYMRGFGGHLERSPAAMDPSDVIYAPIHPDSVEEEVYARVCMAVTGKIPYRPEEAEKSRPSTK